MICALILAKPWFYYSNPVLTMTLLFLLFSITAESSFQNSNQGKGVGVDYFKHSLGGGKHHLCVYVKQDALVCAVRRPVRISLRSFNSLN